MQKKLHISLNVKYIAIKKKIGVENSKLLICC